MTLPLRCATSTSPSMLMTLLILAVTSPSFASILTRLSSNHWRAHGEASLLTQCQLLGLWRTILEAGGRERSSLLLIYVSASVSNGLDKGKDSKSARMAARSEMAWWTAASVIKGREYKSPYDWCQLNNHQGAIGCKTKSRNGPTESRGLPRAQDVEMEAVERGEANSRREGMGCWSWGAGKLGRRAQREENVSGSLESSRKLSRLQLGAAHRLSWGSSSAVLWGTELEPRGLFLAGLEFCCSFACCTLHPSTWNLKILISWLHLEQPPPANHRQSRETARGLCAPWPFLPACNLGFDAGREMHRDPSR